MRLNQKKKYGGLKRRTNKRRTDKRRTNKRRTNKRRTNKRRTNKRRVSVRGSKRINLTESQQKEVAKHRDISKRLAIHYMITINAEINNRNNNNNYIDLIYIQDENKRFYMKFLVRAERLYKIFSRDKFNGVNFRKENDFYKDMYKQYIRDELIHLVKDTDEYKEYKENTEKFDIPNMFIV